MIVGVKSSYMRETLMKKTIRRKDLNKESSETNTLDAYYFHPSKCPGHELVDKNGCCINCGVNRRAKIESELHGDMQRGSGDASPRSGGWMIPCSKWGQEFIQKLKDRAELKK